MERVAFLLEETGERLGCLLNPESVVVRREAGVRPVGTAVGRLTGAGLADEPLLYTGGGRTELELKLLFDVSLAGSTIRSDDVRDLTQPLWQLAENTQGEHYRHPPRVRFVWGKAWNVPALVVAVSERLELFSPDGAPSRSWLRMRLLRTIDVKSGMTDRRGSAAPWKPLEPVSPLPSPGGPPESAPPLRFHQLRGGGNGKGERLDQLAERYYGNPALWRMVAAANNISDPFKLPKNAVLSVPGRSHARGSP